MTDARDRLFSPASLGPIRLRNRTVKSATNEGLSRDGLMTDALLDWHRRIAAGGVGMTTLAYCSVASAGRTFRHQIWMREAAVDGLARFTDAMHAEGAAASIQLGHAGWFAAPRAMDERPMGPSFQFSPHALSFARGMKKPDMDHCLDDYRQAAALAVRAGFDAIEVHLGHGYLLSQFLTPYNNRRRDEYGGTIANRARFPRAAIQAVREGAGPGVAVYAKLNMLDACRKGMKLEEGLEVARMLEADGALDALQLTGGHTTRSPWFLMRGDVPLDDMIGYEKNKILRWGLKVFGPSMMRKFEFEEAFFRDPALQFRGAVDLPLMMLGGINRRETMERAMDDGFEFVVMGRALIHTPDLVNRLQDGTLAGSDCIHCNKCVAEIEGPRGVYCVIT